MENCTKILRNAVEDSNQQLEWNMLYNLYVYYAWKELELGA